MSCIDFDVLGVLSQRKIPKGAPLPDLEGGRVCGTRRQGLHRTFHIPPLLGRGLLLTVFVVGNARSTDWGHVKLSFRVCSLSLSL